jgi:GntP family gluconate:H+ symporter
MLLPCFAAANTTYSAWPFVILIVCIGAVILMISRLRLHPFLALISAALLAGVMAERLLDPVTKQPFANKWKAAVEMTTKEFGNTAGGVGIVIGLASIISLCLMESGAADKVVRRFLAAFGEKRAGVAILVSSYVLSIPIFFDTMFHAHGPARHGAGDADRA